MSANSAKVLMNSLNTACTEEMHVRRIRNMNKNYNDYYGDNDQKKSNQTVVAEDHINVE